jgi:hypothetical protein
MLKFMCILAVQCFEIMLNRFQVGIYTDGMYAQKEGTTLYASDLQHPDTLHICSCLILITVTNADKQVICRLSCVRYYEVKQTEKCHTF